MIIDQQSTASRAPGKWQNRLRMGLYGVTGVLLLLSAHLYADQNDPELKSLYQSLKDANSAAEAAELESQIWLLWLQAPDEESAELLLNTTNAMGQNDLREALLLSSELIDRFPDFAEGWNKRATIYYLMGNLDASVTDIYETLKREPHHFGAISGLGLIFRQKGNLEAALQAFEQVLEISPQSINALRSIEQVKSELGSEI